MKAIVKATGEIVDLEYITFKVLTNRIVYVYEEINKETGVKTFTSDEINLINNYTQIDWEKRRYEIAKAAMQALLTDWHDNSETIITTSIDIADSMIKQLKESEVTK